MAQHSHEYANKLSDALAKITKTPALSAGILEEAANVIAEVGCQALNTHRVGIWTTTQEAKFLKSVAYYDAEQKEHAIQDDFDLSHRANYVSILRSERLLVIDDIRLPNPLSDLVDEYGPNICSLLDAPIRIGGNLAGVVCIEQDRSDDFPEKREWTIEEQNFASSLADFMALAIESAERRILMRRTETMMSNLPGMVYQCLNDPPEFTFTFVSEGSMALVGYTPQELMGNSALKFFDMVHPDDVERLAAENAVTLSIGIPLETTFRIIMKDGTIKWIWERSRVVETKPDGTPHLLEGFYTDITEQRRLEAAELASRAKTEFLAVMSHEIRTPVSAILGISQIEMYKQDLSAETQTAFEKIYSSGVTLVKIINDILDLSKVETGKLELIPLEYNVPNLINDVVQINLSRIGSKPIELIINADPNLPSKLYGDELRIKQILNNLVSNAIKYTEKGYVKLSVTHTLQEGDILLSFSIEDTGQGIKSEDMDSLFTKYTRLNYMVNRATEGTGLGLSIVKSLVNMMDGTTRVESEYGKGSTFSVTVKQKVVDGECIGEELSESLRNFSYTEGSLLSSIQVVSEPMPYGKVLVVDDVETNLYVAQGLLSLYKIEIETALSGFVALEKISNGKIYDIIFMDHMMPKMDGIETTEKIRAMGYDGVIIALTANALTGNDKMFEEHGFDSFISKPINMQHLNEALVKYIKDKYPDEAKKYSGKMIFTEPSQSDVLDPKLLQIFCRDATEAAKTMRLSVIDGDIKLFTTNAHAMKAILANIGEEEMSTLAAELEDAGLSGDSQFIMENADGFIKSLEVIAEKFFVAPISSSENEDIEEDKDFLRQQLLLIIEACKNYDDTMVHILLDLLKEKLWKSGTTVALDMIYDSLFLHSDFEGAEQQAQMLLDKATPHIYGEDSEC